ncbi:M60 family metallopeptidase [Vibrio owensii]|uniref:Peptidase M60 domain-containing protein n=1 Tax=Vibrio owensii CAIM 1854 = LMG 25443 TaxID=1229493 RepID=A0A0C1VRH0_9VIBR|nr:M60 family metallopeptidase [Vibrio owensii]KIF52488.1 hypothetical protein H735_14000 [Vibrio owensii CAIM 1854 = LMG 25443]
MKKAILSIALTAAYSPALLADIPPQTTPLPKAKSPNYLSTTVFDTYIAQNTDSVSGEQRLIVKRDDNYAPANREAYLGFDLEKYNIGGFLESAELKLHVLTEGDADIDILLVSDDTFWNSSFDWAGKPITSDTLTTFSTAERDEEGWVTIPLDTTVLNEIKADGNLSLALKSKTSLVYNEFSSSEAGDEFAPKLILNSNSQAITDASSVRYLNVVAATEENGFGEIKIAEFDVINSEGKLVTRDNWQVLDGTQTDNWELMFDGEHSTHMRIAEGTPNYVNIDLGENIDINALVYTPPKEGYSGRIKDFLVYGSSDNEEWRLIASRTIPHGDGNAPHIAFAGQQSELQQAEDLLTVDVRPNNSVEAERLANSKRTDVTPTGLYFYGEGTVVVWAQGTQEGDFLEAAGGAWAGSPKFPLKEGLNSFNFAHTIYPDDADGMPLYLHFSSNESSDKERSANVRLMASNTEKYPVFYNDETTQNEWEQMLTQYSKPERLEMVGNNMILDIRRSYYSPTNMQELSDVYEEVLEPTELAAGISNSDTNPLHHSDDNPYIFLARNTDYMAKYDDYLAYNYLSLTHRMITPEEARNFWGIWHEVGHTLQTPGLKWSGQGEVSVNIYAFAARAYNTPINELVTMYDPEFTKAFSNLTQVSTYSELERASREMMFHHMFFVFGETVMHDLHQRYRENIHGEINDPEFEIGSTDEEQMNVMAMMASKTTETNLVSFFEYWKFPLTQVTIDTINDYGFPELQEFDQLPSELVSGNPPEMYDMKF